MTPQEIFEYKRNWKPEANVVRIHSDLDVQAKDWCRKHIDRTEWSMDKYTDVYQHTFYFHDSQNALKFARQFDNYIDEYAAWNVGC